MRARFVAAGLALGLSACAATEHRFPPRTPMTRDDEWDRPGAPLLVAGLER